MIASPSTTFADAHQQQTCFRGYRDFVKFVIVQYFIIKIQACARGYRARRRFKQLKVEDRRKKIEKSKRLSESMSRVSSSMSRVSLARKAGQSKYHPESKRIANSREAQMQLEKNAALVIERFFIKIKFDIEMEMMRIEQKKQRRMEESLRRHRMSGSSVTTSQTRVNRSNASHASQHREHMRSHSSVHSMVNDRVQAVSDVQDTRRVHPHNSPMRHATPSRGRMQSIQMATSKGNDAINTHRKDGASTPVMSNSYYGHQHHHGMVNSRTPTPSSRDRTPSIANSMGSEAMMRGSGQDMSGPYQHHYGIRSASPSRHQVPSSQQAAQPGRFTPPRNDRAPSGQHVPSFNQTVHSQSPSHQGGFTPPRNHCTPSRQASGHHELTPTSSFNQTVHSQSPSFSDGRPNYYPQYSHAPNQSRTPERTTQQVAYGLQSNSFATSSHYQVRNDGHYPQQWHANPNGGHQHAHQHQRQTPPRSGAQPIMQGHNHVHPRAPMQSQSPVDQQNVQYQKNYAPH